MGRGALAALALATGGAVLTPATAGAAEPADGRPGTTLVSTTPDGAPANGMSDRPQISGDGRYVTFDSYATNLVPGTATAERRVYRKDLLTGAVEPLAVRGGVPVTAWSSFTYPTDDGDQVAFVSDATALAPPAVASARSVYVRTVSTGRTELVSVSSAGTPANGASSRPHISGDGRFVAFSSTGSNLTSAGGNNREQVYLRDRVLRTTTLVSATVAGAPGNGVSYRGIVSADGRYVTFATKATDLVAGNPGETVVTRDMVTGQLTRVSVRPDGRTGGGARPYMTPDGRYVTFNSYDALTAGDTNAASDTFRWDRTTGTVLRMGDTGDVGNDPTGDSLRLFLSDDGRHAVWNSFSNRLVANDRNPAGDVFVRDVETGRMTLLSLSWFGGAANAQSFRPVMSDDGSRVAYLSRARNLVRDDASADWQVYVMAPATLTALEPDTTGPSVGASTPRTGSSVPGTEPVTFSGVVSDGRGVTRVALQLRDRATQRYLQADGSWGTAAVRLATTLEDPYEDSTAWSFTTTLAPGSYSYTVSAYDPSENRSTSPTALVSVVTAVDSTRPTVAVTAPADRATVAGPEVTFTGTAGDDRGVTAVHLQLRNAATGQWLRPDGTWGPTATRLTATLASPGATATTWSYTVALPPGTYGWDVTSLDAARNASPKPWTRVTVG